MYLLGEVQQQTGQLPQAIITFNEVLQETRHETTVLPGAAGAAIDPAGSLATGPGREMASIGCTVERCRGGSADRPMLL